jgi:hypothetical protein
MIPRLANKHHFLHLKDDTENPYILLAKGMAGHKQDLWMEVLTAIYFCLCPIVKYGFELAYSHG